MIDWKRMPTLHACFHTLDCGRKRAGALNNSYAGDGECLLIELFVQLLIASSFVILPFAQGTLDTWTSGSALDV
jgi:hypothetical protein